MADQRGSNVLVSQILCSSSLLALLMTPDSLDLLRAHPCCQRAAGWEVRISFSQGS